MVSDISDIASIVGAAAGVGIAGIGAYATMSYKHQVRARLADARRAAYGSLWQITGLAAPSRLQTAGRRGVLTRKERAEIHQLMVDWYYKDGNGMLLDEPTRTVFLRAKDNLVAREDELKPKGILQLLPADMSSEDRQGCMSIRQLSLLRTQMKADFSIYGFPYVTGLSEHERQFLEGCRKGLLEHEAWHAATSRPLIVERCGGVDEAASS